MAAMSLKLRAMRVALVLGAGLALIGCQSIREAAGVAKLPPDEFTVLTKAPLVIPPDYNLRPPQPGVASRNELDPDDAARNVLFQNPAAQAAALGPNYSDGEKTLLTKTGALGVDPNIRRAISSDVGQEDQGAAFAQRVLFEGAAPAAPAATAAPAMAPAPAAPAAAPAPAATPAQPAR